MIENPASYPLTRRNYAVVKDEPLLKLVNQQKGMGEYPSNEVLDELLSCITKTQRSRSQIDVASITYELEARLEMLDRRITIPSLSVDEM